MCAHHLLLNGKQEEKWQKDDDASIQTGFCT
jgi:hypothetical protein